ncbi:hypothetical protein [Massilia sp. TSP1-1-2]|uniref:hypothetical protein n=1 Tax=Massilia sp. TSP1-1-2 TaxID=2804649 RepID=UPI003CF93A6C
MTTLISIDEAAAQGIERLRLPVWANPLDHLKIDIFDGKPGPWTHLYAPLNKECNGHDPIDVLCLQVDYTAKSYLPYEGPTSDSVEYKAAQAAFEGIFK